MRSWSAEQWEDSHLSGTQFGLGTPPYRVALSLHLRWSVKTHQKRWLAQVLVHGRVLHIVLSGALTLAVLTSEWVAWLHSGTSWYSCHTISWCLCVCLVLREHLNTLELWGNSMLRLSEIDRFKSHSNAVRFFLLKSLVGDTHISPRITLERVILHSRHMTGVCVILRGGGCNSSTVTTISFYCFLFVFPFISLNSLLFSLSLFLCISLLYFMHYVAFWLCLGRHNQARAKGTIRHAHSHFLFTIPFVFTWS